MLLGKKSLISVVTFHGKAKLEMTGCVEHLGVVVDLIVSPWFERCVDDQTFIAGLDALDHVLLQVRRSETTLVEIEHVSDARVAARFVTGFSARANEQAGGLPVVR